MAHLDRAYAAGTRAEPVHTWGGRLIPTGYSLREHPVGSNPAVDAGRGRFARNAVIQGSAADVIRRAMIKIEPALVEVGLADRVRMLLQVHDELIFEVEDGDVEKAMPVIVSVMENATMPALEMRVPLRVDARAATNWDEAH
jgi:DNA polymerase-1